MKLFIWFIAWLQATNGPRQQSSSGLEVITIGLRQMRDMHRTLKPLRNELDSWKLNAPSSVHCNVLPILACSSWPQTASSRQAKIKTSERYYTKETAGVLEWIFALHCCKKIEPATRQPDLGHRQTLLEKMGRLEPLVLLTLLPQNVAKNFRLLLCRHLYPVASHSVLEPHYKNHAGIAWGLLSKGLKHNLLSQHIVGYKMDFYLTLLRV